MDTSLKNVKQLGSGDTVNDRLRYSPMFERYKAYSNPVIVRYVKHEKPFEHELHLHDFP